MTEKIKIVSSGKLDKEGLKKLGKSLGLCLGGAAIGWLANLTGIVEFGSTETIVATFLPFVANALYKWLGNYESK